MSNHLAGETSPYLLQHASDPVDWYPWGEEAFAKARREDKPVFLSIGYSTCHWCHVMARESFADAGVAALLNGGFVSVKVDREERPDVDSVYMEACRAMSDSAGWPMTLLLTPEGKPFFAASYLPKSARRGRPGLLELLAAAAEKWSGDRPALLGSAERAAAALLARTEEALPPQTADDRLLQGALWLFLHSFDEACGGFGEAPKFPAPHQLIFLLQQYRKRGDGRLLHMAETTLSAMAAGGIFDQVGGGFCRYAVDRAWAVPHFEKMLDDNALLILAYTRAYALTGRPLWRRVAERTADFLLRELRSPEGAFYAALDADSEGEEGKYYRFSPEELKMLLGDRDGEAFCACFGVTGADPDGKSLPNRVGRGPDGGALDRLLPAVEEYRRARFPLHKDDKLLLGRNSLAVAALCALYRATREEKYLAAAREAQAFLEANLREGDALYGSFRAGKRGPRACLTDCAAFLCALLALYGATLEDGWLASAEALAASVAAEFGDEGDGGFFLYGQTGEQLILRPKESYDGAGPSGNSLLALALVRLNALRPDPEREERTARLLDWLAARAGLDPAGHAAYLTALSDVLDPPDRVVAASAERETLADLPFAVPLETPLLAVCPPTADYPLLNGRTAFYVCREDRCLPPSETLRLG